MCCDTNQIKAIGQHPNLYFISEHPQRHSVHFCPLLLRCLLYLWLSWLKANFALVGKLPHFITFYFEFAGHKHRFGLLQMAKAVSTA